MKKLEISSKIRVGRIVFLSIKHQTVSEFTIGFLVNWFVISTCLIDFTPSDELTNVLRCN